MPKFANWQTCPLSRHQQDVHSVHRSEKHPSQPEQEETVVEEGNSRRSGFIERVSRLVTGRKRTTEQDIHDFIDASEEEGLVNEEESEMIRSIFSLGTTIVREVMIPRTEMACVTVDATVRELLDTIIACGHSRIPVYEDSIDNVVGLLYAKDLLKQWGSDEESLTVRTIMRPPYFIPESKNLEQLLQEFKHKRVHLAIVIDEYGGTSGLITIEDLLEQIVGDIQDEYDREITLLTVNSDSSVTADGRLPVEELEEHFGIEIERDKFDSVGGLVFHLTGKIPAIGDTIEGAGLCLKITDADLRRVKTVVISRKDSSSAEDQGRE
jgi:CBS domain containing-hemolysin-like protein